VAVSSPSLPPTRATTHPRRWLWVLAVISAAALAVAMVGRTDGVTLQAIPANESMPDDQAREVAEKTLLVWARERNEGHLANLQELTCPDAPNNTVRNQLSDLRKVDRLQQWNIVATTRFNRQGSTWTIVALGRDKGGLFTLRIDDGRLRVCSWDSVPLPKE
jgi:hypothetical protein